MTGEINGLERSASDPISVVNPGAEAVGRIFVMHGFSAFREAAHALASLTGAERRAGLAELRRQAEQAGLVELHGTTVLGLIVRKAFRIADTTKKAKAA